MTTLQRIDQFGNLIGAIALVIILGVLFVLGGW